MKDVSDSFMPVVACRTASSVSTCPLALMNYNSHVNDGDQSKRSTRTCSALMHPRISPCATPTSVLNEAPSGRNPSFSQISRSRRTR